MLTSFLEIVALLTFAMGALALGGRVMARFHRE